MSLALDSLGRVHVLDQVNRRVLRFDQTGSPLGGFAIESETAEDLVPAGDRTFVLFYDPGPDPGYHVVAYGGAGEVLQRQRLHRSLQLVTGLFAIGPAAAPDLWVERRHTDQILVARRGQLLAEAAQTLTRLGRAPRAGGPRLLCGREGRTVLVRTVEADRYTSLLFELRAPLPVLAVDDWLVGDEGRVLLSLVLDGGESLQRRLVLLRPGAGVLGEWELPATRAADALRPLALGAGARVVSLESDAEGVSLRALELPAGIGP